MGRRFHARRRPNAARQNFLAGRCGGCHKLDLTGDRGPALKGDDFLAHWENGSLVTLFDKIRETMPPNAPNETTDDAKIDIVAYLLQQNGYPVGKSELRADADSLGIIDLMRKGQTSTIPNFSLVQVVGCLYAGREKRVDADEDQRAGADARRGAVTPRRCGPRRARRSARRRSRS